ncbi:hypothetical protein CEXT_213671 [Caerostris extrusa]|uniref:Uncharacterized protein n=1 Tax=Caerostris extrusa TaxID=172846 RepID=A0AAV4XA11_CAEEX|nr:hypothetical protein CEXT_213671 [Caerostris extrusa]
MSHKNKRKKNANKCNPKRCNSLKKVCKSSKLNESACSSFGYLHKCPNKIFLIKKEFRIVRAEEYQSKAKERSNMVLNLLKVATPRLDEKVPSRYPYPLR